VLSPGDALGEFEMVLLDRTVFTRVMEAIYHFRYKNPAYWHFESRRGRILFAFDEMTRLAAESPPRPRFIFAHLLIPEPPFLFTRDGDRAQPYGPGSLAVHTSFRGKEREFSRSYVDQVHFTNEMLARTARAVIERSTRPVVFIIASASGLPISSRGEEETTPERFATLLLVRLPEPYSPESGKMNDSMTLVNLFRVTLDEVFGTALGAKPDRTLISAENRPFQSTGAGRSPTPRELERSASLVPVAGQVDNGP
jgi:hypothetical protein